MKTIEVRERSTAAVSREDYRQLEDSRPFCRLIDDGIVALERTKAAGYGVRAGAYVGQAVVGDRLVRVREKVAGSLAALLHLAEQPEARLSDPPSFADDEGMVLLSLVRRFMGLLDEYLRQGRAKAYQPKRVQGPMPRGRIRMAETMRLWATGRRDMLVYEFHELSPRVFQNQLIGLALHVVDRLVARGDSVLRQRVRTAAIMFEDSGWQELIRLPREEFDERFRKLAPDSENVSSLVVLARLLALHFGVAMTETDERVPFSWFVNLESLFEEAVLKAVRVAAKERGLAATAWGTARRHVFAAGKGYRAKPDVVVWRQRTPLAILDAKYKDPEGQGGGANAPANADVYQLIVHAQAWGVGTGALVYPSDRNSYVDLGVGPSGVKVGYFTIDLRRPADGAKWVLERLIPAAGN